MKKMLMFSCMGFLLFVTHANAGQYGGYPYYSQQPYYYPGAVPAPVPASKNPADELREGFEHLRVFLARGGATDKAAILGFLQDEIARYFDFALMSKWVAGSRYQKMSVTDRVKFQNRLKGLFFSSLSQQFGVFNRNPPDVRFMPARKKGPNEVAVMVRLMHGRGYSNRLVFKFYKGTNGWKVYDVSSDGMSAVAYYRNYFNQLARQHGSQVYFK